MNIKQTITLTFALLLAFQSKASNGLEFLFSNSRIFVVFIVVLVILLGVFFSLFRIEKRIKRLENKVDENKG